MASRKITRTVTGAISIFRKEDVVSSKDQSLNPAVNLTQSVSKDGEYLNIDTFELSAFNPRNAEFINSINIPAGTADKASLTRMVGTVVLSLDGVNRGSNGRVYSKWSVTDHDLTPSDQVPYAERKTEEVPAEAAAAPVAPAADLTDVAPF